MSGAPFAYAAKGEYDLAISDCSKTIEVNLRYAKVYNNRAVAYYCKGEYDKAWEDVRNVHSLGYQVKSGFLKALREASGREK
jgi:tetratricopeptide (TPR) repeat protein